MSDSFIYIPRPQVAGAPAAVAPSNVVVQAQAVFQILDHALRNSEAPQQSVGVILGVRSDDGSEVEIRSAFGIPHTEEEEGAKIDTDHLKAFYTLHRKAYSRDSIVGWYSTNTELTSFSALMQELVSANPDGIFSQPPIHLNVPTYELSQAASKEKKYPKDISVNTYLSSAIGSGDDKTVGTFFTPIPNEIRFPEIERAGIDTITKARDDSSRSFSLINDIQALEATLSNISEMVDRVAAYVDGIIASNAKSSAPASVAIGKYLYKNLSLVPSISKENLEKLFNSHLQDVLMVVYLANTVKTQLQLSSRLTPIV